MGFFDLDDYRVKKDRADESATAPRAFPVALAEATFDGRKQTLRFQPVLFDGGHVFISFRPQEKQPSHDLIAGGGDTPTVSFNSSGEEDIPQALLVPTERAFHPKSWLSQAVQAVERGHFGRLIVDGTSFLSVVYHFYSSMGLVVSEHYQVFRDGHRGLFYASQRADFDPSPDQEAWAKPEDAALLLARLNADEFALHLERERADLNSIYGISSRWNEMSFEEKSAMLPPIETAIGEELVPLMRALVWSDPILSSGASLRSPHELQRAFWRRPRFWIEPDAEPTGDIMALNKRFARRIRVLWPHLSAAFAPLVAGQSADVHPAVLHWMRYRGAYIVEFEQPNAHEHLEARLLLRDWLRERGVELDVLEREL